MGYRSLLVNSFALVLGLLAAGMVTAQTRYVSDELTITLRTGPSTRNAITRNLTSGERLEILEQTDDGSYARVRTANGTEGWVLTQYLQAEPTNEQRLAVAERELETARGRVTALESQVRELTANLGETRTALDASESTGRNLSSELADIREASASAIELRDQNESLRRRVSELQAQVDLVAMENADLGSRSRQNWFVVGAAVLFGGIVIGLVAPSLRPRRKSSW